jgi:hypothetical protein
MTMETTKQDVAKEDAAKRSGGQYTEAMNVVVQPGSKAEKTCRKYAGTSEAERAPATTPPTEAAGDEKAIDAAGAGIGRRPQGIPATPQHDLIFRGGKTIARLSYVNFYVTPGAWDAGDRQNIDRALNDAMTDVKLNAVIAQYFAGQNVTTHFAGARELNIPQPDTVSRGDVEQWVGQLRAGNQLGGNDLASTVFNFLLPPGTVLTTDDAPANAAAGAAAQNAVAQGNGQDRGALADRDEDEKASSVEGLGGYHGSVLLGTEKIYYAVGVFSQELPDGTTNGIVAFNQPWKNVVATFYHELCEARTDADVEEANDKGDDTLIGWTSAQGEECGDFPVFEDSTLRHVFAEIALANNQGTVPVQFQYSNRVHGPEQPR